MVEAAASNSPARLYALVDLARAPRLLDHINWLEQSDAAQCLFEGAINEKLRRVSPYIVDLSRSRHLHDQWLAEGRGQSWGVFLEVAQPMKAARRHVRHFLQVRLPDGVGPVLMRFWDPRVLAPFLDNAEEQQARQLFANGIAYWIEQSPDALVRYAASAGGLSRLQAPWTALQQVIVASLQPGPPPRQ